ncbi:hypothetical protein B0E45_12445 [Sinorhizobium sp. A49]|nr:hypothetical protein B0E45_12445 [Sinorhizobium sp. A49]
MIYYSHALFPTSSGRAATLEPSRSAPAWADQIAEPMPVLEQETTEFRRRTCLSGDMLRGGPLVAG